MLTACRNGDAAAVRRLAPSFALNAFFDERLVLNHGCDMRGFEDTPLLAASMHGHVNVVDALLQCGAAVDFCSNGNRVPPIAVAAQLNHVAVARRLIEAKCDVNIVAAHVGYTALHRAAEEGLAEMCELLVAAGAALDVLYSGYAVTALGRAAQFSRRRPGCVEAIRVLLEAGASPNGSNANAVGMCMPPLLCAAQAGCVPAMALLLKHGALLDDASAFESPIGASAASGLLEPVLFLLEQGCDPMLLGSNRTDPIEAAFRSHGEDKVAVLETLLIVCTTTAQTIERLLWANPMSADMLPAAKRLMVGSAAMRTPNSATRACARSPQSCSLAAQATPR
jgi:ankyrin repeat protein